MVVASGRTPPAWMIDSMRRDEVVAENEALRQDALERVERQRWQEEQERQEWEKWEKYSKSS